MYSLLARRWPTTVTVAHVAAASPALLPMANHCAAVGSGMDAHVAYVAAPIKCRETYGSSPTTQLSCSSGGM